MTDVIQLWHKDRCGEMMGNVSSEPTQCDKTPTHVVRDALTVKFKPVDVYVCAIHGRPFKQSGKVVEKM